MSLRVGDLAPDFTLKSTDLEDISLSLLRGKNVVVLFFPLANTSVCTQEMCSIRDNYDKYSSLDAVVLGISVDSPFALKLWKEANNLNFTLLSDFNKEVCQLYGSYYDIFVPGKFDYKGVAKRSAFVVGKDGLLKYVEVLENAGEEPNYANIKKALES